MKSKNMLSLLAVLILGLSVPHLLRGQVYYSTLVGTVRDASGAVVPNVEVKAIEVSTGVGTSARTNANGDYQIENLRPGIYSVQATASGFKKNVLTDIQLVTAQTTRADVLLEVGTVDQVVEVNGRAPLVQSETSQIGGIMAGQEVEALPVLNRDFDNLALLFPGVVTNTAIGGNGIFYSGQILMSVNGNTEFSNQMRVDGGYLTNGLTSSPVELVNIDSIQELKVETSNYSAEYGLESGGVISVATKHGTNQFHGGLFEFNQNDEFSARNFFAPGKPPLRYNQFGGVVGGPIKKDKLFFFASYEGVRNHSPQTEISQVPTMAERNGDFTPGTGAVNAPIYDPLDIDPTTGLRVQFPGNQIPQSMFNPISKKYLAFWPMPNQNGTPNFVYNAPATTTYDDYSGRIDYNISAKDIVFARYGNQRNPVFTPGTIPGFGNDSAGTLQQGSDFIGAWTHLVGPRSFNDFRFSWANGYLNSHQVGFGSANEAAVLGFPYADQLPVQAQGCPGISFSSPGFLTDSTCSFTLNRDYPSRTYYWSDDFSLIHGAHSIKFGFLHMRYFDDSTLGRPGGGNYTFTGGFTAATGDISGKTGQPFADFLLGDLNGVNWSTGSFTAHDRVAYYGEYIQDNWRVRPRLNLQLGLRYEIKLPPVDADGTTGGAIVGLGSRTGQYFLFPKNSQAVLEQRLPDGNLGLPYKFSNTDRLYNPHWRDFGPHVGFAYRPFGGNRTVIRGGYGIFYDAENFNQVQDGAQPWQATASTPPQTVAPQDQPPPYHLGDNPVPATYSLPAGSLFPVSPFIDPNNWISGRSQQWNLAFQRGFGANWSIETDYIGNHFDHGQNGYLWNRTYMPGYTFHYTDGTSFTITDNTPLLQRTKYPELGSAFIGTSDELAHGDYEAAQFSLNRRFSHGFMVRASYVRSVSKGLAGQRDENSSLVQDEWNQESLNFYRVSDVPDVFIATYVWQLPGFNLQGFRGAVLGGWETSGVIHLQSGERVDVREEFPQWLGATSLFVKPVMTCDPNNFPQRTLNEWFNTACFQQPPVNQFGSNSAINAVRADGLQNADLSLLKNFKIHGENQKLQLRAEFFNAFNHPQFGDPNTVRGSATFGRVTSAGPGRIIQFGLKYEF